MIGSASALRKNELYRVPYFTAKHDGPPSPARFCVWSTQPEISCFVECLGRGEGGPYDFVVTVPLSNNAALAVKKN